MSTVQNTQASPEFLTLPQVIPTSIPIPIPRKSTFLPFHLSSDTKIQKEIEGKRSLASAPGALTAGDGREVKQTDAHSGAKLKKSDFIIHPKSTLQMFRHENVES